MVRTDQSLTRAGLTPEKHAEKVVVRTQERGRVVVDGQKTPVIGKDEPGTSKEDGYDFSDGERGRYTAGPKLTPAAASAIRILTDNPGIPARSFGHLMWPGHWAHEQWAGKGKQGVARGRAMWLKAGSYLWHLQRLGLVSRRNEGGPVWYATEGGQCALARVGEDHVGESEEDHEHS